MLDNQKIEPMNQLRHLELWAGIIVGGFAGIFKHQELAFISMHEFAKVAEALTYALFYGGAGGIGTKIAHMIWDRKISKYFKKKKP